MPNSFRSWQTPAWSPDGSRIAASFITGDDPDNVDTELHTASSADGSARQQHRGRPEPVMAARWLFDRVLQHSFNGDPGELRLVHPDGTGGGLDCRTLRFGGPTTRRTAPRSCTPPTPRAARFGRSTSTEASGTSPLRLTNNTAHDGDPVWSPDGKKIAFRSDRHESAIYTMNADGTNPTRITNDPDYQAEPSWQADPRLCAPKERLAGPRLARHRPMPSARHLTASHGSPLASGSCSPPAGQSGLS